MIDESRVSWPRVSFQRTQLVNLTLQLHLFVDLKSQLALLTLSHEEKRNNPCNQQDEEWHNVQQQTRGWERLDHTGQDHQSQPHKAKRQACAAPKVLIIVAAPFELSSIELKRSAGAGVRL